MRTAFQFQIMLIVVLNLMFVHITGAVSMAWLIPMYVLTLSSPWLVSLQDSKIYRGVWNAGVIGIFFILMIDAVRNGISFLLEDGLILAAFCQVHLLNVIRRQVGADLLFFNSFLIALVTSLFCQDLAFSVVFALYSIALIIALHTSAVSSHQIQVAPEPMRWILRDGFRRAFVTLVVTGFAFAFWPRDFYRQGFVDDQILQSAGTSSPGFSEEIRLGQSAMSTVRQRVVMKVEVDGGMRERVPELWRGATLSYYDRRGWQGVHLPQSSTIGGTDGDWKQQGNSKWIRGHEGETITTVRATFTEPAPQRLFLPLAAHTVEMSRPSYLEPLVDGTFRYNSGPPLSYAVELEHGSLGSRSVAHLAGYRQLNRDAVPDVLRDHLTTAMRDLPPDAGQDLIVGACEEYLSSTFSYLAPGERGAARNLEDFLAGASGGHCEYFATALALMLRTRLIPCRVVTGFRVGEWSEEESAFLVRDSHAHAWVEVWSESHGWVSADATPAASVNEARVTWWDQASEAVHEWWESLIRFDGSSRREAWRQLLAAPGNVIALVFRHPFFSALGIFGIVALWRRRQKRKMGDPVAIATREYRSVLRQSGLVLGPAETPRELFERARSEIEDDQLKALERATRAHEAARYRSATSRKHEVAAK